jgi:hypothetical protein
MIRVMKDKLLFFGPWLIAGFALGSAFAVQPPKATKDLETEIGFLKERMTLMRDRVDRLDVLIQEVQGAMSRSNISTSLER